MTTPEDPFAAPGDSSGQPYGTPPQPPAYGTPPAGYGTPPGYGAPPPAPGYGAPYGQPMAMPQLAGWGSRVGAALIDALVFGVPYAIFVLLGGAVGGGGGTLLVFLGLVVFFGGSIWNLVRQGKTGQTIGKTQLGLRLVRQTDGQYVGAGMSILRAIAHFIDGLPCYLGYFWPLWDAKKQTFADKVMGTLVIKG